MLTNATTDDTLATLIEQRGELTDALACCERGAFPGSREWRAENRAMMALSAFDAAHPEAIRELERRRFAAIDADTIPAGGR